jgi:hypothetical protein
MPLSKGRTNNPNGRPKGSQNKANKDLRDKIKLFIDDNWDAVQKDLEMLSPKERIDAYLKLLEYSLPKLNRTSISFDQPRAKNLPEWMNEPVDIPVTSWGE